MLQVLIPIATMLAQKGLGLLADVVMQKGKEFIEEKTGVKLEADKELTPEQIYILKKFEMENRNDLIKMAYQDTSDARTLAAKEMEGSSGWTKVLTITHRPLWSIVILFLFTWKVLARYFDFPDYPWDEMTKDIVKTVIIFYFGGRTIEKVFSIIKNGGGNK